MEQTQPHPSHCFLLPATAQHLKVTRRIRPCPGERGHAATQEVARAHSELHGKLRAQFRPLILSPYGCAELSMVRNG